MEPVSRARAEPAEALSEPKPRAKPRGRPKGQESATCV